MPNQQNRYTAEQMRPIVSGYKIYVGTKKAYCLEHGLNPHTLDYWRNRITALDSKAAKKGKPNKFIPIQAPQISQIPQASSPIKSINMDSLLAHRECIQLHMPDGKRIELPLSVSEKLLISLLQIRIK